MLVALQMDTWTRRWTGCQG
uniref:HMNGT n=1 Tax=Arundo donax TaxID=35708 RepID=A0A0A9ARK0_ARUDO